MTSPSGSPLWTFPPRQRPINRTSSLGTFVTPPHQPAFANQESSVCVCFLFSSRRAKGRSGSEEWRPTPHPDPGIRTNQPPGTRPTFFWFILIPGWTNERSKSRPSVCVPDGLISSPLQVIKYFKKMSVWVCSCIPTGGGLPARVFKQLLPLIERISTKNSIRLEETWVHPVQSSSWLTLKKKKCNKI